MLNALEIGARITELRQGKGLSQEAFGELLGVSRQAVSKWETGQAVPDTDKVVAMAQVFGVTSDYILTGASSSDGQQGNYYSPFREDSVTRIRKQIKKWEFKSKTKVFGIPLVHIKAGRACGFFSLGLVSTGVFSLGLVSAGLFSLGLLSLGLLLSFGTFSIGSISFGAISAGILALGGVAFGVFTLGGVSIGVYSMGGCAIASKIAFGGYARGFIAIGDKTEGIYTWHVKNGFPQEVKQEVLEVINRELPNTPQFIKNFFR